MKRRDFVFGVGALAMAARAATADEKEIIRNPAAAAPAAQSVVPMHAVKEAIHIGESDLPFVSTGDGATVQLLQVDLNQGIWIVRTMFDPGTIVQKHYHTGPVFALTLSGSWFYEEYPAYKNKKGSYLYEPAHSVHTLTVPKSNSEVTDVWFAVTGANLNMDDKGDVTSVVDAQSILAAYRSLCKEAGKSCDNTIVIGEA